MAEPIKKEPRSFQVYFDNTWDGRVAYTVIDRDNNGILRPEEGDDVYKGPVGTRFPSLYRVPHHVWKNKPTEDIREVIANYREEEKNKVTPLQLLGFAALIIITRLFFFRGGVHSAGPLMETGGYSVYPPNYI